MELHLQRRESFLWLLQISLLEKKENIAIFPLSDVKIKSIEEKNGAINLIQRIALQLHQLTLETVSVRFLSENTWYDALYMCQIASALSEMSFLKMSIHLENKYAINL